MRSRPCFHEQEARTLVSFVRSTTYIIIQGFLCHPSPQCIQTNLHTSHPYTYLTCPSCVIGHHSYLLLSSDLLPAAQLITHAGSLSYHSTFEIFMSVSNQPGMVPQSTMLGHLAVEPASVDCSCTSERTVRYASQLPLAKERRLPASNTPAVAKLSRARCLGRTLLLAVHKHGSAVQLSSWLFSSLEE